MSLRNLATLFTPQGLSHLCLLVVKSQINLVLNLALFPVLLTLLQNSGAEESWQFGRALAALTQKN